MGIRFGEYLQRSSSRAQRTARAASRPCRRRAARRAAQRADVRREVVEPGATSGDKRLERPLVVVVQAAAPQACQLSSGALPTPPTPNRPGPSPALRTWSCPTPPLSTALGTGAGTAARPRRSSRGSSPCPGRAAPGRTRASAASSSSQSDGACVGQVVGSAAVADEGGAGRGVGGDRAAHHAVHRHGGQGRERDVDGAVEFDPGDAARAGVAVLRVPVAGGLVGLVDEDEVLAVVSQVEEPVSGARWSVPLLPFPTPNETQKCGVVSRLLGVAVLLDGAGLPLRRDGALPPEPRARPHLCARRAGPRLTQLKRDL